MCIRDRTCIQCLLDHLRVERHSAYHYSFVNHTFTALDNNAQWLFYISAAAIEYFISPISPLVVDYIGRLLVDLIIVIDKIASSMQKKTIICKFEHQVISLKNPYNSVIISTLTYDDEHFLHTAQT